LRERTQTLREEFRRRDLDMDLNPLDYVRRDGAPGRGETGEDPQDPTRLARELDEAVQSLLEEVDSEGGSDRR
jgi:hypothetical protein